jgi:alpha-beta hydrolase superfamily lysophospholipase
VTQVRGILKRKAPVILFVISMGAAIALSCDVTCAPWAKTIIVVDYTIILDGTLKNL